MDFVQLPSTNVHQHGGSGHYNPIIQQDEEILETVDDEEIPDSGSNVHDTPGGLRRYGTNTDPVSHVEPECPDQIHGSLTTGRTTAAEEK
jgi:hypothetical protein